jgi:hypothetical protein
MVTLAGQRACLLFCDKRSLVSQPAVQWFNGGTLPCSVLHRSVEVLRHNASNVTEAVLHLVTEAVLHLVTIH